MIKFIKMFRDKRGASAAEYALILAIVGAAIALAAIFLGDQIGSAIDSAGSCVSAPNSTNCG
jgi:pilus assembly protein Flp/PilA